MAELTVHHISCSQSLQGYLNIPNITRLSFIIHVYVQEYYELDYECSMTRRVFFVRMRIL